jgi:protoheme IX farnesyltransferase
MLVATSMAAAGVAALNQWHERDTDARMKRTADRPLPSGKIPNGSAFVLGWLLCIGAMMLTYAAVNRMALLFVALTMAAYLGWYTPFKRFSRWSTEIGAVAGALPPLIGWAAAQDEVSKLGWILFGVMFFWQIPHFMAVAWMYRKDYSAVEFPMLPVRDESGRTVARWSLINACLLVAVSLLPCFLGMDSIGYGVVAGLAGIWFVWRAVVFTRADGRDLAARKLFLASIAYLPVVLGALSVDRIFFF